MKFAAHEFPGRARAALRPRDLAQAMAHPVRVSHVAEVLAGMAEHGIGEPGR